MEANLQGLPQIRCSENLNELLTTFQGLQLLEFLIKNGSERVIDDARSHLSLLKMLRQFHFIDQNGKDQGVNVRNRSKELAEMLGDVDRIRAERKKARNNRNKFGGVEGGSLGGGLSSGSKYGGFGSEDTGSYGAYSGGVYGDGGGFGGNTSGFQDSTRRDRFEEYDEFDEGATKSPTRRRTDPSASIAKREPKQAEAPKKKEPEIDILGFDDNEVPPETPPKELFSNGKKAVPNAMDDLGTIQSSSAGEDDFDDFQSATPAPHSTVKPSIQALPPQLSTTSTSSATQFAAPKPVSAFQGANLSDLVSLNSVSPAPSTNSMASLPPSSFASLPSTIQTPPKPRPTGYQAAQPNYFTSVPVPSTATPTSALGAKPSLQSSNSFAKPAAKSAASSSGGDVFGSLWSSASAGAGIKKTTTPSSQGPNLASLAKEKASAGIWGASTTSTGTSQPPRPTGSQPKVGGGLDDLLG